MPCYDSGLSYEESVEEELEETTKKVSKYEGALCAIFNALERIDLLNEVVDDAEVYGGIKIWPIYKEHKEYDKERISTIINNLSKDELQLLEQHIKMMRK